MEVSAAKRTPAPIHLSMRGPAISTKPHLLQHEGGVARLLEVLEQALKKT